MAYLGNNALPFDPTRTVAKQSDAERFSGDNSTVAFTLSRSVVFPTDLEILVENVQQEPVVAYNVSGNTLTFTEAPPTGTNNIQVLYRGFGAPFPYPVLPDGAISYSKLANNIRLFVADNFLGDGSSNTFIMSEAPADANTVYVSIDGVVQRAPTNYTVTGTTITFAENPPASSNVHVRHLGFRTTQTVTAIPPSTYIPQANLVNPYLTGTLTGGDISTGNVISSGNITTTSLNVSNTITSSSNVDFKVGASQNTAFRIENTGQLYNSVESTEGTDYRNALYPGYMARAWVNFNGTGTVAIRASGNVTSITDGGTGIYTVNFTTAMPDANYAASGYCDYGSSGTFSTSVTLSPSSLLLYTVTTAGGGIDNPVVQVLIFR
jgi:hypothetical protein